MPASSLNGPGADARAGVCPFDGHRLAEAESGIDPEIADSALQRELELPH